MKTEGTLLASVISQGYGGFAHSADLIGGNNATITYTSLGDFKKNPLFVSSFSLHTGFNCNGQVCPDLYKKELLNCLRIPELFKKPFNNNNQTYDDEYRPK
jgi:hypothetical protein